MTICRHPLRIVTHAPAWLACDTCHASFPHNADCPGLGTPGCAQHCVGGADPTVAALDALYALPAAPEHAAAARPDDTTGAQRPVSLGTPCARCGHSRNWHENGRCTLTAPPNRCGCRHFTPDDTRGA